MDTNDEALMQHIIKVQNTTRRAQNWNTRMTNALSQSSLVINGALNRAGFGKLAIKNPVNPESFVPVETVPDPLNEGQIGRFGWGFHMTEGYDGNKRIPMSHKTLLGLFGEYDSNILSRYRDHRSRTAYYRACTLFPGFFINLTVDISAEAKPPSFSGPELFVAYNAMNKLVDEKDPGVIVNGAVDDAYFFRPIPKLPKSHLRSVS